MASDIERLRQEVYSAFCVPHEYLSPRRQCAIRKVRAEIDAFVAAVSRVLTTRLIDSITEENDEQDKP